MRRMQRILLVLTAFFVLWAIAGLSNPQQGTWSSGWVRTDIDCGSSAEPKAADDFESDAQAASCTGMVSASFERYLLLAALVSLGASAVAGWKASDELPEERSGRQISGPAIVGVFVAALVVPFTMLWSYGAINAAWDFGPSGPGCSFEVDQGSGPAGRGVEEARWWPIPGKVCVGEWGGEGGMDPMHVEDELDIGLFFFVLLALPTAFFTVLVGGGALLSKAPSSASRADR